MDPDQKEFDIFFLSMAFMIFYTLVPRNPQYVFLQQSAL